MKRYFSPSTKGFYIDEIEYPNLPMDVVEITEEQHNEILHEINVNSKQVVMVGKTITYIDTPAVVPTWSDIRTKRDRLLSKSDYTQMPDWPGDKVAWATYRQQLRDLTNIYSKPEFVEFPTPPGA